MDDNYKLVTTIKLTFDSYDAQTGLCTFKTISMGDRPNVLRTSGLANTDTSKPYVYPEASLGTYVTRFVHF